MLVPRMVFLPEKSLEVTEPVNGLIRGRGDGQLEVLAEIAQMTHHYPVAQSCHPGQLPDTQMLIASPQHPEHRIFGRLGCPGGGGSAVRQGQPDRGTYRLGDRWRE